MNPTYQRDSTFVSKEFSNITPGQHTPFPLFPNTIWVCPKIMVPPNHPFWGFPPIFGSTPICFGISESFGGFQGGDAWGKRRPKSMAWGSALDPSLLASASEPRSATSVFVELFICFCWGRGCVCVDDVHQLPWAPKTYINLEVCMVNNLVFRWPKPLFFMVLMVV